VNKSYELKRKKPPQTFDRAGAFEPHSGASKPEIEKNA